MSLHQLLFNLTCCLILNQLSCILHSMVFLQVLGILMQNYFQQSRLSVLQLEQTVQSPSDSDNILKLQGILLRCRFQLGRFRMRQVIPMCVGLRQHLEKQGWDWLAASMSRCRMKMWVPCSEMIKNFGTTTAEH